MPSHSRRRVWLAVGLCVLSLVVSFASDRLAVRERATLAAIAGAPYDNFGDPAPTLLAARRLAQDARAPLYAVKRAGASYIYPPIAAIVYRPFATPSDPRPGLRLVNRIMLWVAIALACWLGRSLGWMVLAIPIAALLFYPLVRAVQLNQASVLITVMIGGALVAIQHRRRWLAGAALAVAIAIKPQLVLAVPLLAWRLRPTLVATLISGSVLLAVSLIGAGIANHVTYVTDVLPSLSDGYAFFPNQSWNGLWNRIVHGDMLRFQIAPPSAVVRLLTIAFGLATLAAGIWATRRARTREVAGVDVLAFAWLVATLASPIAWEHHYAPCLFLFVRWLSVRRHNPSLERYDIAIAGGWICLSSYFEVRLLGSPLDVLAASYGLVGGVILAIVWARSLLPTAAPTDVQ